MITRAKGLATFQKGFEAVWSILQALQEQLREKDQQIEALQREAQELRHRLGQNSQNSHNPPSQDRFVKPKSLRRPTGRPRGGQPGHPGHTLRQVPETQVDEVHLHTPTHCTQCGTSLEEIPVQGPEERRQVFDLPPLQLQVTEHRLQQKTCPQCGHLSRATAPLGVEQPSQYGRELSAFAVYLLVHQLLPFDRLRQLFGDLFKQSISTGTLQYMLQRAADALVPVHAALGQKLQQGPVLHKDETGIRIDGKDAWLHVSCTDQLTHLAVHPKRGREAIEATGILPSYEGVVVHDCFHSYFTYTRSDHALCNAHIRRELQDALERTKENWPQELDQLLLEANRAVEITRAQGRDQLPEAQYEAIHQQYRALVEQGRALHPLQFSGKPGRKKTKVQNLLERLAKHEEAILRFVDDLRVPFTNNQAEQDLRMAKVKQKISGVFRTETGAQEFYRIRGYVSTARKNGLTALEALQRLFQGNPFLPTRGP